jgi:hypothetical protein
MLCTCGLRSRCKFHRFSLLHSSRFVCTLAVTMASGAAFGLYNRAPPARQVAPNAAGREPGIAAVGLAVARAKARLESAKEERKAVLERPPVQIPAHVRRCGVCHHVSVSYPFSAAL